MQPLYVRPLHPRLILEILDLLGSLCFVDVQMRLFSCLLGHGRNCEQVISLVRRQAWPVNVL